MGVAMEDGKNGNQHDGHRQRQAGLPEDQRPEDHTRHGDANFNTGQRQAHQPEHPAKGHHHGKGHR